MSWGVRWHPRIGWDEDDADDDGDDDDDDDDDLCFRCPKGGVNVVAK